MTPEQARLRFLTARVARLATVDAAGRPHLVPVVFAVTGDLVYIAVDAKPKRSTALRRLANVRAHPALCLLVDAYDDADWDRLFWVRADGKGRVLEASDPEARRAVDLLTHKYPQYRTTRPAGEVLAVTVERWSGWTARPDPAES